MLQQRGDIPADWIRAVINAEWQPTGWAHESHRWNGAAVIVDFAAAKTETKNRLRREREPLMAAQDVAFSRALETGASTATIVAEKTRLRDITKRADSAKTLDELKAITVV